MEDMRNSDSVLKSDLDEVKSAIIVMTEAMILFQEFIENEIGVMSYFRDSGTYDKLKETFNRLRLLPGNYPLKKTIKHQHPLATEARLCCDLEDEEQVEVDIDYNDDDPIDEITIRQVYSVPSPAKIASTEALLKNCSSTVTITPVYPDEKNKNQYMFAQPNGMIIDKITPSEVFPVDHPIPNMMIPSVSSSPNHEGMQKENTFGHPLVPLDLTPSAVTGFPPPPPPVFVASPKPAPALKENWRKSYHRMGNVLKKKTDKAEKRNAVVNSVDISGTSASSPPEYGANLPLNLKKKLKRPSECSVKCNICGKSYSSKGVMSRHIKEAHQADPQFPCFYCPNKFRNGPARLEHMNTSHPEDMNSSLCPYCMRKSSSVAGKRNHMMLCARKHNKTVVENQPGPSAKRSKASSTITSPSTSDSGVEMDAQTPSGPNML